MTTNDQPPESVRAHDIAEAVEIFRQVKTMCPDSVVAGILALAVFLKENQYASSYEEQFETFIELFDKLVQFAEDINTSLGDIDLTVTETHKQLMGKLGIPDG